MANQAGGPWRVKTPGERIAGALSDAMVATAMTWCVSGHTATIGRVRSGDGFAGFSNHSMNCTSLVIARVCDQVWTRRISVIGAS